VTPSVLHIHTSNGGVPKRPTLFGEVTPVGVAGDRHNNPKIHGGPQKALLIITSEGLEELKQVGFPVYPGALGENITTVGLNRRDMRLGQRYRIGEIVVELSRMRQPCDNLDPYGAGSIQKAVYDARVKAGDHTSPVWGLAGFYTSVLQTGTIRPGDAITLLEESV
jgi:MOSC domain-containing protein YiiM